MTIQITPNLVTQLAMIEARERALPKSQTTPILELLSAKRTDQDFIFEAFKASMKEYVQWAWGWDEEAQRKGLLVEKNLAHFQLIKVHGGNAGALLLEKNAEQHYLRTIFLLPKYHQQGIGSLVIESLQHDAKAVAKPLGLRVIHINPARRLYERLGFKLVSQDEKTLLMRWQAVAP